MKYKETPPALAEKGQTENGGYLRKQSSRAVRKSAKPGRFWKKMSILAIGLSVVLGGVLVGYHLCQHLYYSRHFQLRQVEFFGAQRTQPEQLRALIFEKYAGNLLRLSLKEIRTQLETNPWILRAQVRRIFPDRLSIHLTERRPIALASVDNGLYLVAQDGVFLDRYSSRYGRFSYPILSGMEMDSNSRETDKARVELFLRAMEELDGKGARLSNTISEVDLTDAHNLVLIPNDESVRVLLGEEDFYRRYQSHLKRLNKYRQVVENYGPVEAVDLRFNGQVIYQRVKTASVAQSAEVPNRAQ